MDIFTDMILQAAASPWLLLVMFVLAVVDGFFPPVPSETVLVAGAAAAIATGEPQTVALLALVAAGGAVVGDNIAFALGRAVGPTRFRWMRGPRATAAFARARTALERRGAPLILGARYIPVGRVTVNMSAGALGYPWRRFLPVSAVAGVLWAASSAGLGALAGQWFSGQPLLSAVVGVVAAIVIGLVIDRIAEMRRRRAERRIARSAAPAFVAVEPAHP